MLPTGLAVRTHAEVQLFKAVLVETRYEESLSMWGKERGLFASKLLVFDL